MKSFAASCNGPLLSYSDIAPARWSSRASEYTDQVCTIFILECSLDNAADAVYWCNCTLTTQHEVVCTNLFSLPCIGNVIDVNMSSVNPSETFPLLLQIAFVLSVAFSSNMASMSPSGWYPREREPCLVYSKLVRLYIQTNRFSLCIIIDTEIIES